MKYLIKTHTIILRALGSMTKRPTKQSAKERDKMNRLLGLHLRFFFARMIMMVATFPVTVTALRIIMMATTQPLYSCELSPLFISISIVIFSMLKYVMI